MKQNTPVVGTPAAFSTLLCDGVVHDNDDNDGDGDGRIFPVPEIT